MSLMGQIDENGAYHERKRDDISNMLQPAAALKVYAPIGVKFWENQEAALDGLKEFADGWFEVYQLLNHEERARCFGNSGC